jgi:hypothetical protein
VLFTIDEKQRRFAALTVPRYYERRRVLPFVIDVGVL